MHADIRLAAVGTGPQAGELDAVGVADRELERGAATRQAQVVEMRYFGGLAEDEIVAALDVSPRTVRRDWDFARAWLLRELSR